MKHRHYEEAKKPTQSEIAPEEWKRLFMKLWTASQGIVDATDSLFEDKEWGDENPHKMYTGKGKEGPGEQFAIFQARRRLSYDDFSVFRTVVDQIRKLKIPYNNLVDRRGMKT
jgi:hypothetical protein